MFKNYLQLLDKIDNFVADVMAKHAGSFKCGPGCAKCCVAGITVWRVEVDNIRENLNRSESRVTSHESRKDGCNFLTEGNLCAIYEARPIVCRLWGAPLAIPAGLESEWGIRDHETSKTDAGTLTCCDLNFQGDLKLEDLPIADAINVETVIRTLAAINHVYCKENGLDPEERIPLLPT